MKTAELFRTPGEHHEALIVQERLVSVVATVDNLENGRRKERYKISIPD